MEVEFHHTDSVVLFSNSQGDSGQGTLVHLTRNLAVFEVYNPYSLVQLSEVLQDVRILRGEVLAVVQGLRSLATRHKFKGKRRQEVDSV